MWGLRRLWIAGLTAGVCGALLCGSASAAQFTVGTADSNSAQPSVAVDQNGNAWVTWTVPAASLTTAVDVCEIPAGHSACATTPQTIQLPGGFGTYRVRSYIFFDPIHTTVDLVAGGSSGSADGMFTSQSVWNGTAYPSFPGLTQVGNINPEAGAAAIDASDGLVVGTQDFNESLLAQGASLTATPPGETSRATLVNLSGGANVIFGSALSFDGKHLVAAWGSGLYPPGGPLSGGPLSYAYINSSSPSPATINSSASWTEGTLNDGGGNPTLASGPAGTFLAETIPISATGFLDLRSFTGTGFTSASPVYCSDASTYGAGVQGGPALAEDQTGRLHLAYIASGSSGEDVRYVTLVGAGQSAPETLAHNPSGTDLWKNPSVSGNATSAIAVWIGDTTDNVFASWLPGPMPATSGCGEPPATAPMSGTFGGLTVTVTTPAPNACVANGKKLNVSLSVSGKHAHAKLRSAQFFIDKGIKHVEKKHGKTITVFLPNATAHHAPASLQIPISELSSGIHMMTVRLTLARKIKGRTHLIHRMLRAYFTVC